QRNTEVNHETGESSLSNDYFAIVHNAGTTLHDFTLKFQAIDSEAIIGVAGSNERSSGRNGTLKIPGLRPGENRWVALKLNHTAGKPSAVQVTQMENGKPVNGFEIRVEPAALPVLISENLDARRIFFQRLGASAYAKRVAQIQRRPTPERYLGIVAEGSKIFARLNPEIRRQLEESPFALGDALTKLD